MRLLGLTKARLVGPIVLDYFLSSVRGLTSYFAVIQMIYKEICVLACRVVPCFRMPAPLYCRQTVNPTRSAARRLSSIESRY